MIDEHLFVELPRLSALRALLCNSVVRILAVCVFSVECAVLFHNRLKELSVCCYIVVLAKKHL